MRVRIIRSHCLGGGRDVYTDDIVEMEEREATRKIRDGWVVPAPPSESELAAVKAAADAAAAEAAAKADADAKAAADAAAAEAAAKADADAKAAQKPAKK